MQSTNADYSEVFLTPHVISVVTICIFIAKALFLRKHGKLTVAAMLTKEGGRMKASLCVGFIIKIYRAVVD